MSDQPRYDLFAVCQPGLEKIVADELRALGIASPRPVPGGVEFRGFLTHLYKVNLWSRTAERVLLRLREFRAESFRELHHKAARTAWEEFLTPGCDVSIRATCHKSILMHTGGVAERIVHGISDRLGQPAKLITTDEENKSARPNFIVVRIVDDRCLISLDTSGALLHFRGYRQATAKAPLRETLAAAMLFSAGWTPDRSLLDPFCGSGTIPIEAALIARHIAPGRRRSFAFFEWPQFKRAEWEALLVQADGTTLDHVPASIQGSDRDAGAIEASRSNAERAGVLNDIELTHCAMSAIEPNGSGDVITNPPYGQRIGDSDVRNLYAQFGKVLRAKCAGWRVAMLSSDVHWEYGTGLKFQPIARFNNGGIKVRLVQTNL
ncbi:MAG TPA: class I SAM-dependent RNA methyltransferase [Anaerolineae bacterium]|nr:class I SAM-dependent RNA methyltransferase [Anaerolineae bacterium]